MRTKTLILACFLTLRSHASVEESSTGAPLFAARHPLQAPATARLLLQKGARLAICGDSITEQRMYSRIIENYLTACTPELKVAVRQIGWGGERADGFLKRMTNDCLRFHPPIATTSYGMNKVFTGEQLSHGVNLAAEFVLNPFSERFARIDAAVSEKQDFETRQIKALFRVPGDDVTVEQITAQTEKVLADTERQHAALENVVRTAYAPVTYTLKITAE
jgi:hypothetical protein